MNICLMPNENTENDLLIRIFNIPSKNFLGQRQNNEAIKIKKSLCTIFNIVHN